MSASSAASSRSIVTDSSTSAWFTTWSRSWSASSASSRSRVMPSCRLASESPTPIFAPGLRSMLGFVRWIVPRKLPPTEPWRSTGRAPPTRSPRQDRIRVSPRYSPRPRESAWMSPNWSVSRNRFSCLRTCTLPRSVAFSIGPGRGSNQRMSPAASSAGFVAPRASAAGAIRLLRQRCEAVGLLGHRERIDQRIELPVEHRGEVVDGQADPVVGHPVLGEVVRPDLVGAVAAADHQAPHRGVPLALRRDLEIEQPRAQHRERLRLVLVLALPVLDLDD